MKLATIRTAAGTRSARVDTTAAVETGHEDAGALLSDPTWRELAETADGPAHPVVGLDFAPVVPRPETFEGSTPIGPWLVTTDVMGTEPSCALTCEVDGETMQKADTADLVFGPAELVSYISGVLTLMPGDVIATGTPGGVGHARRTPAYLRDGSRLVTRISQVGEMDNLCVCETHAGKGA